MRAALRIIAAFIILLCMLPICRHADADDVSLIKQAVTRHLCHELYWDGRPYQQGIPLNVEIQQDGDHFYVWIPDAAVQYGPMTVFLTGRIASGTAAVALLRGYNSRLGPRMPGYAQDRQQFSAGAMSDVVALPRDCTPQIAAPTPQKTRMLQAVKNTVEMEYRWLSRSGAIPAPRAFTLTIADFNVDDPWTYVLVEPGGKVLHIMLHDPQAYDSDEYERSGEYPSGEVYRADLAKLRARIRQHGIIHRFTVEK
jgi:hypothetical protein